MKFEPEFRQFARAVRAGRFGGRTAYALSMAHGVYQSLCCGYDHMTAIELGVANGHGLQAMHAIAQALQDEFGVGIQVIGFDTGSGLPGIQDHRDHPEIWTQGEFCMEDFNKPDGVELILGDVSDTVPEFCKNFNGRIGFVSLDLDLYSSTKSAMPLFEMPADCYLPATPVYVDDTNVIITYSAWSGESLALNEFNQQHHLRKFEEKNWLWNIQNFYVFHVFDHPIRTGAQTAPHPLTIQPF